MFLGFFFAFAIKAPMCAGAHLAAGRRGRGPAGDGGAAGRRARQGRHLRDDPVLPAAVPGRRQVGDAGGASCWRVISILYGALLAIGQTDIMRLIAYTSVSHFGFIVLGIFAMTSPAQTGSTLYMVNHGFSTAALFLVAAMLVARRGSRRIPDFGGWQRVTPAARRRLPRRRPVRAVAAGPVHASSASSWCWSGTFPRYPSPRSSPPSGIVLAALYILLMYQRMMTGPKPESAAGTPRHAAPRGVGRRAARGRCCSCSGFFPKPVLDVINPAVTKTMQSRRRDRPGADPRRPAAEGAVK